MSFNASHFCAFLSYQRAGKLVSGKRKPWGSGEIKSCDWSALCSGFLGSGHGSTQGCSALGAHFALGYCNSRESDTDPPASARWDKNIASEITVTCWWTEDTPGELEYTQCLHVEERKRAQCHSRAPAHTGMFLKDSIMWKRRYRLELFWNNQYIAFFQCFSKHSREQCHPISLRHSRETVFSLDSDCKTEVKTFYIVLTEYWALILC